MAGFAAVIDPDPRSRKAFIDAVHEHFRQHYDGIPNYVDIGNVECAWRACPSAPVSIVHRRSVTAWVLGHIDRTDACGQSAAELLATHVEEWGSAGLACYSGFFVAIVVCGDDLYVVTDRLGLFPCYYAAKGGMLLLGSSSYLPVLHPMMPRRLNLKGLVGHLLCLHEVLGEPLWQGCRRLGVGELLHFNAQGLNTMREQSVPISDACFGLPYEAQLDRTHEAMSEAFEPYRGKTVSLLFSGGLDSRLIAGYLNSLGTKVDAAYTFGLPWDTEYQCARQACRTLHWRHVRVPMDFSMFPALADRQIVTEQLANGISNLSAWRFTGDVTNATAPLITGAIGDSILGGYNIPWAYVPAAQDYSFDKLFYQWMNAWGLSPRLLCKLLPGGETPGLIAEIIEQLRDLYESLPGYEFQKAWQFVLRHRMRFHVGGILRRIAHTVWPSAPYTHEAVLKVCGGMPAASIMGRRLQKDLLTGHFPTLAAIPLDANSPYPRPLAPSLGFRLWNRLKRTTGLHKLDFHRGDKQFYYRMYDINNPGWRRLREEAFHFYDRLPNVLDIDGLRSLLPDPGVRIEAKDAIINTAGHRSLLAFVLWHARYADMLAEDKSSPSPPCTASLP